METAIRLARRMIVDGRIPTPEEARRQLHENTKAQTEDSTEAIPFQMEGEKVPRR
jgi:hypothetical protein